MDTSTLTGLGNVTRNLQLADPLFVNFSNGDYHLRAGSPAINATLPTYIETADIVGVKRPSRPGLGAYEYQPTP